MSRWSQARERNRAMVAKNAERVLADTAYDRLRTPSALLSLVVLYAVTTVAIPIGWVMWGAIPGLICTVACLGAFLLLRVAVRSQADLPDEVLDERMRSERDSVYVGAYRILSTSAFLAANLALVAVAFGDGNETITFDYESVSAVYWTLLSLVLGAPSLILAIRARSRGSL